MSTPSFELPAALEASAPPNRRDAVRLLIVEPDRLTDAAFPDLVTFLDPGDLVVVNVSGTLPAAVDAIRPDGREAVAHFSTETDDGRWVVEFRPPGRATGPVTDLRAGELIRLPGGLELTVDEPYPDRQVHPRLWRCQVDVDGGVARYLAKYGRPIRYAYVPSRLPLAAYQTVFGFQPGSAEMPSAGRPFTAELIVDLVAHGVAIAPITLHTGVSSQEAGEPPLAEPFVVPAPTARLVNSTRRAGGRVVAVGTTVTRALESAAAPNGHVRPARGWTDLVLGPDRPARVVDGLITGWHAPGASHLNLLQAVAGAARVDAAYHHALDERYRWHEFGDSCLLLPDRLR